MTILSLAHPETQEVLDTFNLETLTVEIQERFQLTLAHFFPMAHTAKDWYTESLQASLQAVESLLLRRKHVVHLEEKLTIKPVDELTHQEREALLHVPHSDGITINDRAHVSFRMPSFEDNPALDTLIADFKRLVAFTEHGRDLGAHLQNSDYPEAVESAEPVQGTVTTPDVPIASSAIPEASVEDGIPAEALAEG